MSEPGPETPVPPDEAILPDEAGDAYVAHSTPDLGTSRNVRALVLAVCIVGIAVAIGVWIAVSH